MFSNRLRWLLITTGLVTAIALFPIFFLLYPAILIASGAFQPRFPKTARWFAWIGIAELWVVFTTYYLRVFLPHPLLQPHYMIATFSLTMPLLVWCSGELITNELNLHRHLRSVKQARNEPIGMSALIAVGITLYAVWDAYTLLSWYIRSHQHAMTDAELCALWMRLVFILIVVAFDISLGRRVLVMKRGGALEDLKAG